MRKLNILAAETHFPDESKTNAADWWRTVRPMQELQKRTDWEIDITKGVIPIEMGKEPHSKRALFEWQRIGMNYDLVYYSYNHSAMFYSFIAVVTRKFRHAAVMDYDDNILQQDLHNPLIAISKLKDPYEDFRVDIILRDVDSLTVTNQYLKDEYDRYLAKFNIAKKITILPNFIDLETYKMKEHPKKKGEVVIGFFGSTSHQPDLNEKHFVKAISYIKKKYPYVRFEIMGNFVPHSIDGVPSTRLIEGSNHFYDWVKLWQDVVCGWDICLAPNMNTPFNKSRSNIKWQEAAAAKIPLVASDIGLYTDPTVFNAKTTQDWIAHLSKLVEDENFRRNAGEAAYKAVKDNWTIQGNWKKWADAMLERAKQ